MTNGAHMTCNDLFIAVELSACCEERAEKKKKNKFAIQLQDFEEQEIAIHVQGKSILSLNVKELDLFLAWHQTPKVVGAKKTDKLIQWLNIVASGEATLLFAL